MNKERKIAKKNAIVVFNKAVKASELNKITQGFEGDVVIRKKLIVDQEIDISCNLYVIGGITRKSPISEFNINVNGDLYCYGQVHCNNINISGYFYSENHIYSKNIKVGENFLCDAKIDAYGYEIVVAGNLECKDGIVAEEVRILGTSNINGSISVAKSIKTGY